MELCNFSSSENCQCFKVTPISAFTEHVAELLNENPKRSRDRSASHQSVHSSVSSVVASAIEWQPNRMSAVYRIPCGIAVTTASPVCVARCSTLQFYCSCLLTLIAFDVCRYIKTLDDVFICKILFY